MIASTILPAQTFTPFHYCSLEPSDLQLKSGDTQGHFEPFLDEPLGRPPLLGETADTFDPILATSCGMKKKGFSSAGCISLTVHGDSRFIHGQVPVLDSSTPRFPAVRLSSPRVYRNERDDQHAPFDADTPSTCQLPRPTLTASGSCAAVDGSQRVYKQAARPVSGSARRRRLQLRRIQPRAAKERCSSSQPASQPTVPSTRHGGVEARCQACLRPRRARRRAHFRSIRTSAQSSRNKPPPVSARRRSAHLRVTSRAERARKLNFAGCSGRL